MTKKKKFAVILSGCGVYDGTEIHEATLSLFAISKNGSSYEIFAPDMDQFHVVNHITGEEMPEKRNVLVEAARIARGNIRALSELIVTDFDALLFPGGFGAAKNLSDWAFKGPEGDVHEEVVKIIKEAVSAGLVLGALCISPVLFAKVLGDVEVTIGADPNDASAIESTGSKHIKTNHGELVIDEKYKLVTTPCYMLDASIAQIGDGAENIVKKMIEM
jgi:enhancing lycopene biosynthesis protein 2